MLIKGERSITKEQYERAQMNYGYITDEDLKDIFSESELIGYGIYGAIGYARYDSEANETTYIVLYTTSDCCD